MKHGRRWELKSVEAGLLVLLSLAGCSRSAPTPPWQTPHVATIGENDDGLFSIELSDGPGITIYCACPLSTSCDASTDVAAETFNCSGQLKLTNGVVIPCYYRFANLRGLGLQAFTLNGTEYSLTKGTVFYLDAEGHVSQLPFAGLPGSSEYLHRLRDYFQANPRAAAPSDSK